MLDLRKQNDNLVKLCHINVSSRSWSHLPDQLIPTLPDGKSEQFCESDLRIFGCVDNIHDLEDVSIKHRFLAFPVWFDQKRNGKIS